MHTVPAVAARDLRPPPAAGVFDEIAELAAQLCGAAHAAITLHEDGTHRPLAQSGALALEVLPRDSRFCCAVLHAGEPLEVCDAHFDVRFHDDPLVASGPRVRFYAGVPLLAADGTVAGTLSVLDARPNSLDAAQRGALWKLADVVVRLLDDMAARREAEASLSWQATHDSLTELANRRQFERSLERLIEVARQDGGRHALLYVDLDQFKVVNDTCGHLAGDALLRQIARVLAERMRREDCLARLGGDEFGALLAGCDLARGVRVAQQLLAAIRGLRFAWAGQVFALGASIGVVEVGPSSRDPESVMASADAACYLAKDKGRNQVQPYREDDAEIHSRQGEMGWYSRITRCLEEDRFFLECQRVAPIGDDGESEYLELLLRMRDEQGRVVPPGAFIPAAERFHLMGRVDRWVVARALGCLANLARGANLPRFGINLSGMSLGDPAFADEVCDRFERGTVPGDAVCFEITETAAISDLGNAGRFIRRLRAFGCRFALDDFGSGLGSLTYLKALPVDYVKIDGAFVRGCASDDFDLAAVEAIRGLARSVGAKTIAECVDGPGTRQRLAALGIDFVQGWGIHRPEPYPDLAARMDFPRLCARAA